MKQGYNVKKALVFGFERKSKVVNDFVQNFSCGPLPSIYFPIKLKNFCKNFRNLIDAKDGRITQHGMTRSNSTKQGFSVEKRIFFDFERKSKVIGDLAKKNSCGPLLIKHPI